MKELVRPALIGTEPYDPGLSMAQLADRYGADALVKLNWNEDLFGPLPGVLDAVAAELATNVAFYPEQAFGDFREAVAAQAGCQPGQVVPGHGIQALVMSTVGVFVALGDRVVIPKPTYGLYRQVCQAAGANLDIVPTVDLRFDLDQMLARAQGAKLLFVCDPNNPTGDRLTADEWRYVRENLPAGCVAVVDEAYADYIDPAERINRVADIDAGHRVVVLRTFSKLYGIAGLRLGYGIVPEAMVPYYDAVQEPFNLNRAALSAGLACLAIPEVVEERRRLVASVRDAFAARLADHGIATHPSASNFVLVHVSVDDQELCGAVARHGYMLRPGHEFGMPGYVRVTVAPEIMDDVADRIVEAAQALGA
jgi:histidinol-phosphate aminotransferase